jgi:hypothetical protein
MDHSGLCEWASLAPRNSDISNFCLKTQQLLPGSDKYRSVGKGEDVENGYIIQYNIHVESDNKRSKHGDDMLMRSDDKKINRFRNLRRCKLQHTGKQHANRFLHDDQIISYLPG